MKNGPDLEFPNGLVRDQRYTFVIGHAVSVFQTAYGRLILQVRFGTDCDSTGPKCPRISVSVVRWGIFRDIMIGRRSFFLSVLCCLVMLWVRPSEPFPFKIPYYGRWIIPTTGQIWPKPQQQSSSETFFVLRPTSFSFQVCSYHPFPYKMVF